MSETSSSQKTERKTKVASVSPFTIEADHPRNQDLLLQAIPNCRLRSRILPSRTVSHRRKGQEVHLVPTDQGIHLGKLPPIPGMRLKINPANLSYEVVDPLEDNPELAHSIEEALKSDNRAITEINPVPKQEGKLDVHRMKTLCREVCWLLESKHATVVHGTDPVMEDVEDLPGKFLLNPGSQVPNGQPKYEDDFDEYAGNLQSHGG